MFNAFFKQYILVCSISVDNHSRRKQFTQCFTAFIIFFNDLNTDAHVKKLFRKIIGNRAPTNDQSILYLVCFDTGLFKKITCFRRRSHNTDHIIFFKHKSPLGITTSLPRSTAQTKTSALIFFATVLNDSPHKGEF